MKKFPLIIFSVFLLMMSSCAAFDVAYMTSTKMNALELGMPKELVTKILGNDYTIAEKRMEGSTRVEVISYRNNRQTDEVYKFLFKDNKLEKWYMELVPRGIVTQQINPEK